MLGIVSGTALPWKLALLLSTLPGKKPPIGHGLGCLQLPSGHKTSRYLYSIWTSTVWPYFFYNKNKKVEWSLVFKPIILKLNFYFSHPWPPTWISLGMFKDGCWVPRTACAISLASAPGIFRTPRWFEHVAKLKNTLQRRDRGKKASGSQVGAALSQICFLCRCLCIEVRRGFWLSLSWATCSPYLRCPCLSSCPCLRIPSSAWYMLLSPLGQVRLWTLAQQGVVHLSILAFIPWTPGSHPPVFYDSHCRIQAAPFSGGNDVL